MEVRDTAIQQVVTTSVLPPLPMMEDYVKGAIVKTDGQREYDVDPPLVLWDSSFYRGWKVDK